MGLKPRAWRLEQAGGWLEAGGLENRGSRVEARDSRLEAGAWGLEREGLESQAGGCRLEAGGWRLGVRGLEAGGWSLEAGV